MNSTDLSHTLGRDNPHRRLHAIGALLLSLMLLVGIIAVPHLAGATDFGQEEIAAPFVSPTQGIGGTLFDFSASGFEASEAVSFWVNAPDMTVYSANEYVVNAAQDGSASWIWASPTDAMPGTWSMVAQGVRSGVQHVIMFEVEPGAPLFADEPQEPAAEEPAAEEPAAEEPAPEQPVAEEPAPEQPVAEEPAPEQPAVIPTEEALATVEPASGMPGTTFTFSASGFQPSEAVSFWANDPIAAVHTSWRNTVSADSSGRATWTWTLPHDTMPGQWSMVGQGVRSQIQYVFFFTVEEHHAAEVINVAYPPAGEPGTTFTFTTDGFYPRERINYWLNDPATNVLWQQDFNVQANEHGQVIWHWASPSESMTGQWSVVAHGLQSGMERVIVFEINGHTVVPEEIVAPENAPGLSVSPTYGTNQTIFTFSAEGFQFRESVGFWANDPIGFVYGDSNFSVRSEVDGTASWTWQAPAGIRPGVWSMVARGAVTGTEHVIFFVIQ